MGISAEQAQSVKDFWNSAVAKDLQKHGIEFYIAFLTTCPDQHAYFKKFATVPISDFRSNAEVAKQGLAVMQQLGKYVNVVDKPDELKAACKPLAVSHKKMNVVAANFQKISPCIVDYVAGAGGDKAAWTAAVGVIGDAIVSQQ